MSALLAASVLSLSAFAQDYTLQEGVIQAHTSVLGDSDISPQSTKVLGTLSKDASLESLKGNVSMKLYSLKSDNDKRDEHMYEALHAKENKETSFRLESVKKQDDGYHIIGTLTLNNVEKPIDAKADIQEKENQLNLKGDFQIKMTDFKIEPPTLLFLSVRDEVDVHYDLHFAGK